MKYIYFIVVILQVFCVPTSCQKEAMSENEPILDTIISNNLKITRTTFNDEKGVRMLEKQIYIENGQLKTKGLAINGFKRGAWKIYDPAGKVLEIRDYETGVWDAIDTSLLSYHQFRVEVKAVTDSILIANYGKSFFDRHLMFNIENSTVSSNDLNWIGGRWCGKIKAKPSSFSVKYDIVMGHSRLNTAISLSLNGEGQIIESYTGNSGKIEGLQSVDKSQQKTISESKAIDDLMQLGLLKSAEQPDTTFLKWEKTDRKTNNGKFIYSLLYLTEKSTNQIGNNKRKILEYKAYNFDLYKGEFIEASRMLDIYGLEQNNGFRMGISNHKEKLERKDWVKD